MPSINLFPIVLPFCWLQNWNLVCFWIKPEATGPNKSQFLQSNYCRHTFMQRMHRFVQQLSIHRNSLTWAPNVPKHFFRWFVADLMTRRIGLTFGYRLHRCFEGRWIFYTFKYYYPLLLVLPLAPCCTVGQRFGEEGLFAL